MDLRHRYVQLVVRVPPLEKRYRALSGERRPELSDRQLLGQLRILADGSPTPAVVDPSPPAPRCNLLLALQGRLASAESSSAAPVLSLGQRLQLRLVELLFQQLESEQDLHSAAYGALQRLQLGLARCLIETPSALFDPNHPARSLFELILRVAKGFDDASGIRAQALLHQIEQTVAETVRSDEPVDSAFASGRERFVAFLNEYQRNLARFEQRQIEKEQGEAQMQSVRDFVHRTIDKSLVGRRVPDFVAEFLHEVWAKYLYISFLRHGIEDPEWHQGVLDLQDLIWSVSTRNAEKLAYRLPTEIADSLSRIREHASSIHHQLATDRFFAQLVALHSTIIQGREPGPELFGAREVADGARKAPVAGPGGVLEAVARARPGNWYRMSHRGLRVRSKLIDKDVRHRYLLFSNYSGIATVRLDFDDFAAQVDAGTIGQIDLGSQLDHLLTAALAGGEAFLEGIALELQAAEQQHQAQHELVLRLRLEEEERRRAEARRLSQQQSEAQQREMRALALGQAVVEVERLQPGAMVELIDEQGQSLLCSLGLKLKTTRKLLFIDRVGRKVAEHTVERLAERVLDGSAAIIDQGGSSDKVLEGLRWTLYESRPSERPTET